MYQVDSATASVTMPAVAGVGPNPGGFFSAGSPGVSAATVVDEDIMNTIMMEIANAITLSGITLSKASMTQLYQAMQANAGIKVVGNILQLYMSPSGLDSNTGLSAGSPMLTFAGIQTLLLKYNLVGGTAVINLAAGTYAGHNWNGQTITGAIQIKGAGSTLTTINGTGGTFGATTPNAVGAVSACNVYITGLTLTASGGQTDYVAGGICVYANSAGVVTIGPDITFGVSSYCHMLAASGGAIGSAAISANQGQPYKVTGGAQYHIYSQIAANISLVDSAVTFVGTPAFSGAFLISADLGYIGYWNNTFTGGITGVKYLVSANSILNLAGAGGTGLPGTTAGTATAATGGYLT